MNSPTHAVLIVIVSRQHTSMARWVKCVNQICQCYRRCHDDAVGWKCRSSTACRRGALVCGGSHLVVLWISHHYSRRTITVNLRPLQSAASVCDRVWSDFGSEFNSGCNFCLSVCGKVSSKGYLKWASMDSWVEVENQSRKRFPFRLSRTDVEAICL